ncbi:MAG: tetratricopeptide repeat protein [Deltaproteobacteria bacterium]|nr:tetratricopeptide repeat protein [Deltaproteobacteria bacterium]
MTNQYHFYHSTTGANGGGVTIARVVLIAVLIALMASVATAVIWNFLAPESFASFHGRLFGRPLEIRGLELTYARQPMTLVPGARAEINPSSIVKLVGLETNRWRNYDLRLYSPDLDISFFLQGTGSLVDLLGVDHFLEPQIFRIQVKEGVDVRAEFLIQAAFTAADWAAQGNIALEIEKKIGYYRKALELDPGSVELKNNLTRLMAEAGLNRELADFLEGELTEASSEDEIGRILGELTILYRKMEDRANEIDSSERLLAWSEKNGRPTEAIKSSLAAMIRHERPQRAAELYEQILKSGNVGHQREILLELVSIYRELKEANQQIGALERLLEIASPEDRPTVWNQLLALRGDIGDEAGQLEAWAGLAQSLPDGPDKANAYKSLGYLQFAAGDNVKAREAFEAAAKLDQNDPSIFVNLARLAIAEDNREAYRENLIKALALEESPELSRELALSYEADGLKDKAAELWLALASTSDSQSGLSSNDAGSRLINLLRPPQEEFSEEFEKRLYQFSENSVEFYNLGVAHFKAQNWPLAQKAFDRALELDRDAGLASDIRGYLLAIHRELGQTEAMLVQAMELYREDPSSKEYRDLVLDHFEGSKNWAGLTQAALKWTQWQPNDPDNWRFLALGQKNQGQEAQSAKSLYEVAKLEVSQPSSWLAAAEALEKTGDLETAKQAYEKVIELEPTNERAESALLRLALTNLERNRSNRP